MMRRINTFNSPFRLATMTNWCSTRKTRSQLSAAKENEIALKERHRQLLQDELCRWCCLASPLIRDSASLRNFTMPE